MSLADISTEITYIDKLVLEAAKIVENDNLELSHFSDILNRNDLLPYAQWSDDKAYMRICLFENTDFELILICWNTDAKTAVHNHNEQNCWVFSVDAAIEEVLYCAKGQASLEINRIAPGGRTFMGKGNKCHSLENKSDVPVMTLHLYNEPIKKCEVMGLPNANDCLEWADINYDIKL